MNKNHFGVIIFSRMGSSRLPGKAMKSIGGIPLIERVIKRAQCTGYRVVLATTDASEDDILQKHAASLNIDCYRGDTQNVLGRAIEAAKEFNFKYFARLCGDRPLFSIQEMQFALDLSLHFSEKSNEFNPDLITNFLQNRKVKGLTTEVIRTESLISLLNQNTSDSHREHLTSFFYQFPSTYNLLCMKQLSNHIPICDGYAVDELNDYERMNAIFKINSSVDLSIEKADEIYLKLKTIENE
jgi:spore coat polysaccharide biosynthesis protein SpsF